MIEELQTQIKVVLEVLKNAAAKAPPNIVKWGYAALFFSAIAALVLSLASGDKFKYLVVSVVLVLALALALWALDTFMRSQVQWVRVFASVFAVAMVLLISAGGVYVAWWAIKAVTATPVAPVAHASLTVLSAGAVRLQWLPTASSERVAITVRREDEKTTRRLEADEGAGSLEVTGLTSASQYRFTLMSFSSDQSSPPIELRAWTNAENLRVESKSSLKYSFYYSGPLDQVSGKPADSTSPIAVKVGETLVGEIRFSGGELDGETTLKNISGNERCDVTFRAGQPSFKGCGLDLPSRPERNPSAPARYVGEVRLAGGDEGGGAALFGPFRLVFSGRGLLTTLDDYSEAGVFRDGLLFQGQVANKRISEQGRRYFTVESGVPQGPYMDSDSDSVSLGALENERMKNGFEIRATPNPVGKQISLAWAPSDSGKGFGPFNWVREESLKQDGCDSRDYLNVVTERVTVDRQKSDFPFVSPSTRYGDWVAGCYSLSGDTLECRIASEALTISATKTAATRPKLAIELSSSPTAMQELYVGELTFRGKRRGLPIVEDAPLAIASLCTAGLTVRNGLTQKAVSSNKFCQAAAAMFSRLYICA
jgi:hypothetical protein